MQDLCELACSFLDDGAVAELKELLSESGLEAAPSTPEPTRITLADDEEVDLAELTKYLWLGSRDAAADKEGLASKGITHIANVADDVECFHGSQFTYLHCEVVDGGGDESIVAAFQAVTEFVREATTQGGVVLLHCLMGINRSATVSMAVLMNLEGWTLQQAFEHVTKCRTCVSPFRGNRRFIAEWELETRGTCTMPDWLPQRDEELTLPQRPKLGPRAGPGGTIDFLEEFPDIS